jgi:hypothetical protein
VVVLGIVAALALAAAGLAFALAFLTVRGSTSASTPTPATTTTYTFTDPSTRMTATVTDPKIDTTGDARFSPHPGHEFFVVHVTLHNGAASSRTYFGVDFHAIDQVNVDYGRAQFYPVSKDGAYLGYGLLPAGRSVSGSVVFEIPVSTSTLTVSWDDSNALKPPKELGTFQLR